MTVYGSPQRPQGRATVPVPPPPSPSGSGEPAGTWVPGAVRPRNRHVLRYALAAAGVVVVLVAAGAGLYLSGLFTERSFDVRSLQLGVLSVLQNDYRLPVETVACPAGVRVQAGLQFTCDVRLDGRQQPITVRVLDDEGRYEVARPS